MKNEIKAAVAAVLIIAIATTTAVLGVLHRNTEPTVAMAAQEEFTLVIDAGHGGEDGGAVTRDGLTESAINLEIARRTDALAAFLGIRTVLTRNSETLYYSAEATTTRMRKSEDQKRRLELIRGTHNAVLLSIHQNIYKSASPYGAQVLYAKTNGSAEFGTLVQTLLVSTLDTSNRRAAERVSDTILLMNSINCPAVLVECGFLSNPAEEALLRTDSYRLKLAVILTAAVLQHRDELNAVYNTTENAA